MNKKAKLWVEFHKIGEIWLILECIHRRGVGKGVQGKRELVRELATLMPWQLVVGTSSCFSRGRHSSLSFKNDESGRPTAGRPAQALGKGRGQSGLLCCRVGIKRVLQGYTQYNISWIPDADMIDFLEIFLKKQFEKDFWGIVTFII